MFLICGDDHYTRDHPHHDEVAKLFKGNSQPAMLTHPFPKKQSMLSQVLSPPAEGNPNHPPSKESSFTSHIYMFNGIDLTTRTITYETLTKPDKEKVTNSTPPDPSPATISPPSGSLHIEKPIFDFILRPPKRTICKSTFNPSSRAAKKYDIVEYLAQERCAMSSFEDLQQFPRKNIILLATIESIDPDSSNNITFNLDNFNS
jgi:hypothetical protein